MIKKETLYERKTRIKIKPKIINYYFYITIQYTVQNIEGIYFLCAPLANFSNFSHELRMHSLTRLISIHLYILLCIMHYTLIYIHDYFQILRHISKVIAYIRGLNPHYRLLNTI